MQLHFPVPQGLHTLILQEVPTKKAGEGFFYKGK